MKVTRVREQQRCEHYLKGSYASIQCYNQADYYLPQSNGQKRAICARCLTDYLLTTHEDRDGNFYSISYTSTNRGISYGSSTKNR